MAMPSRDLYRCILTLLVRAREAHSMNQADVAAKLACRDDFVAEYEAGRRRLDPAEYIVVVRAIGVDPFELLQQAEEEAG